MDAASIVDSWKRRLTALAERPPYVFRETSEQLMDEYKSRQVTFVGFSESEIVKAESLVSGSFPAVFREYLLQMGKSPGHLFLGSDLAAISEFGQFRVDAEELLKETDQSLTLPNEAVVFLFHQGYIFSYVLATGGFDSEPMQWAERQQQPTPLASTFAEFVDAELCLMEKVNQNSRESGGYWLKVHSSGVTERNFPSRASGVRPLDL